jgi:hypothetical protein
MFNVKVAVLSEKAVAGCYEHGKDSIDDGDFVFHTVKLVGFLYC